MTQQAIGSITSDGSGGVETASFGDVSDCDAETKNCSSFRRQNGEAAATMASVARLTDAKNVQTGE